MEHAYVGRGYSDAEVEAATQRSIVKVQTAAVQSSNIYAETAKFWRIRKSSAGFRGVPSSARARSAIAA